MHLKKAEWCEPWMTDEEKRIMKKQMAAMRKLFNNSGIPESPLISMRAIDIGIHHLMVRRLEAKMGTGDAPAVPVPTFAPDEPAVNIAQLVEQIGRTRERLRKAIRELEDVCAKLGKPVEIGIADKLLPFVREARHLIQNGIVDEDISESPHINYELLDDASGSGDIPELLDDASGSGDIPVPDSPPNPPDIPDTPARKATIPVHPPLLTFPNADRKSTTYRITYDV